MKKLLLCFISLSLSYSAFAKSVSNDVNASTASDNSEHKASGASSGLSGIYNVDLYTGTAGINIPIYDYSLDGLPLGVSLSYDTRGIRVDQVASACGLGWNLNAGGYIERTVYGIEDDQIIDGFGPDGSTTQKFCKGTFGTLAESTHDNTRDPQ